MKRLFVLIFVLAIVLAGCGPSPEKSPEPPTRAPATEVAAVATPVESGTLEVAELVDMLRPSTVLVYSQFSGDEAATGTGIIFHADGYAVTNAHVVEGAAILKVKVPGAQRWLSAKIVGISPCDDLAVIDIAGGGFTPAILGESDNLKLGEELIALGYPLASDLGTDLTVTRGIVSKLPAQLDQLEDLIQTDTSINPGNSGGPLVNMRGEVVGINTVKMEYTSSGRPVQGLNFAIGISFAKEIIANLQWGENVHWIGLNTIPNTAEVADYYGLTTADGLLVYAAATGSPADRAGLEPGDVLVKMEGVAINSKADLCAILKSHSPDDVLRAEIVRGGSRITREIGGTSVFSGPVARTDGPSMGRITFATNVTDDDKPINPSVAFPEGTTKIYAIFDHEGIKSGALFKYIWYRDGLEDVTGDEAWAAEPSGTYWIYIYNDDGVIPGNYDLYLYLDEELLQKESFSVGEVVGKVDRPSKKVSGEPAIGSLTFAAEVTDDDEPIDPSYYFPAGTTHVYGVFEYSGIPEGAEFKYVYFRDGAEDVGNTFEWTRDSSGTYYVYLYNDDGIIPAEYDLYLYVNGELIQEGGFVVQESGQGGAYESYSNEALRFSLQYPVDWELDQSDDGDTIFFSAPDGSVMVFVSATSIDGTMTPEDLATEFIEGFSQDYPGFEVADTQKGTFGGFPALMTTADFPLRGDAMRLILYSIAADNGLGYSMGEVGAKDDLYAIMDDVLSPLWQSFYFLD